MTQRRILRTALRLASALVFSLAAPLPGAAEGNMITADGPKPSLLSFLGAPKPVERQSAGRLTRDHSVSVYEFVRIEDLLAPGEAMPDPVFHKLYVTARAPARMIAHCDDVVATIGSLCDVGAPNVRDRGDGRYEITARLYYQPSFEMGERKLVRGGGWQTGTVDFSANRKSGEHDPVYNSETRRAALDRVRSLCATLVAQYGTCVPTSIRFDRSSYLDTGSDKTETRMSVSVSVNVYAMQTEASYREVQQAVRAAAEPARQAIAPPQGGAKASSGQRLILLAVTRQIGELEWMTRVVAQPWQGLPVLLARGAL